MMSFRDRRLFFLFFGLFILWGFGFHTVWARLMMDVHGVVTSSIDDPYRGASRYATTYNICSDDGRSMQYVAGPTDAALARSLPVGSRVEKSRWELDYRVDGQRRSFPIGFYAVFIALGVWLVAVGISGLLGIWPRFRQ
jgi:hypothetical protein